MAPQIWDVQYSGDLNGTSVTLTFHYDPLLLPGGTDESQLGIWHYNTFVGEWQFGGVVNTADHTISYTTDNFSPFELGVAVVPEPSTMGLLVLGVAVVCGCSRCARLRISRTSA